MVDSIHLSSIDRGTKDSMLMNISRSRIAHGVGATIIAASLSLAAVTPAFADDDDPTAYLYAGTCDDLANAIVVDEIDDLDDDDLSQIWRVIGNDQDQPRGLLGEEDDIDDVGDVQALVDQDHAIVVHEYERTHSAVLVCGDVEGDITVEGTLLIELDEYEESGWEGRAFLEPEDEDDHEDIEFTVGIYPAGSVEPLTTATPAS